MRIFYQLSTKGNRRNLWEIFTNQILRNFSGTYISISARGPYCRLGDFSFLYSRLQQRLVAPQSTTAGPCPSPGFTETEEFFREFIVAAMRYSTCFHKWHCGRIYVIQYDVCVITCVVLFHFNSPSFNRYLMDSFIVKINEVGITWGNRSLILIATQPWKPYLNFRLTST
jgi:hypothetical protein